MSVNKFDRLSRRQWLAATSAAIGGSGGFFVDQLARAAQASGRPHKACILLWMSGGPSQLETLDPKPNHRNGGPTRSIATSVPGIAIAENLPGVAKVTDKLAIIRSMSTREGDHGRATQLMTSGHPVTGVSDQPHLGSIVAQRMRVADCPLPPYISITPTDFGRIGPGYLGPQYSPLIVSGDNQSAAGRAGLTIEHLTSPVPQSIAERRYSMLRSLSAAPDATSPIPLSVPSVRAYHSNRDAALSMIESGGGGAFNLDEEAETLRDAYGRNRFGQGCLLARRLVERGAAFVEVTLSASEGGSWDSHVDNFNVVTSLCQTLDPAWSTLLTDLSDRGMLDDTLVVWMGEFGRTPRINPNNGRDHFPDAWSMAMAGGNVHGGQVFGKTSPDAMSIVDRPVRAADLFATVLKAIDIDPSSDNETDDRPRPLTTEDAKVIGEVMTG